MRQKAEFIINRIAPDALYICALGIFSLILTYLTEWIFRDAVNASALSFVKIHGSQFKYEALFVFLFILILYSIFRRADITILVGGFVFVTLSTVCYLKSVYRNEPLLPWDFGAIGEAADVSGKMDFHFPVRIILSYLLVLIAAVLFFLFRKYLKPQKLKLIFRLIIVVLMTVLIFYFTKRTFMNKDFLTQHGINIEAWDQLDTYTNNGFIYSFLLNLQFLQVDKPADYSKAVIDQAVSKVKSEKKPAASDIKPNIIIIQSESLCDVDLLKNVQISQDVMPEINYLRNSAISGYLFTPNFGGGTSNSEFEMLTGDSMSYLPSGSVAYQQYMSKPTFSIVSYLKNLGYTTNAVHSYQRQFWNREEAYKMLGIDKFIAEDNFVNPQLERKYISDLETMKMTIKQYEENKSTGKPFFNLTVTMQNHGAWSPNEYPADETVNVQTPGLSSDENGMLSTYVTGVKEADASLKYIVDYFSKVKDPTIILFYGDHLPYQNIFLSNQYLSSSDAAENFRLMHSTPFVIWSNYDQKHLPSVNISMYDVLPYLTEDYNLPHPAYFDFLNDEMKYYKGYAGGVYLDANGKATYTLPAGGDYYFKTHYQLEYDLLFGNQYASALTK